ncbi:helix-turn-helix domain-containing protein [Bradyrhizobium oligotrophicum]|uniref:helix-turn-helix domain-containing protein n=1 Tax=Bradyrhizobium oligotrophicum TaxID=44255 RepID=UPI003EBD91D3
MTGDHDSKPRFMRTVFLWLQQIAADRLLPPLALHVATILASYFNQRSGEAWPTQETLANRLGISTRAVSRNLFQLAALGHLGVVISRGRRRPNVYRPVLKNPTPASGNDPQKPDAGVGFSQAKTGRARQQNQTRVAEKPDARDQKTRRQRRTELSNELSKELSNQEREPLSALSESVTHSSKASFLSKDWQPSQADKAYARDRGWTETRIGHVAEKLRDYYQDKPMPIADSSALWRRWVLRERDDPKDEKPPVII